MNITLYEPYDFWYTPFWYKPIIWIPFIIVMILLISSITYILFKRLSQQKEKTALEKALYELELLKPSQFTNSYKPFYFKITVILKNYLSERYQVDLEGKTDDEVIKELIQCNVPKEVVTELQFFFSHTILIKFSSQENSVITMNKSHQKVLELIGKTILT